MRRYELLIFLTGAVTLALEVLASRIMTPYFGVSLYIWAGILSITLAFLAVGYHLGGVLTRHVLAAELEPLYLATPILSAASIGLAALLYPVALPWLAEINLVLGSFVGALLLLGLPLIALSAMNPLLIAMQRGERGGGERGDAGAGRVFFISTVGSVAGVVFTAFVFIPSVTNFRAALTLAVLLCLLAAGFAATAPGVAGADRRRLMIGGVVVAVLTGALWAAKKEYLEFLSVASTHPFRFEVKAEYTSIFGNVKIAEVRRPGSPGGVQRFLVQDGLVQNRTLLNNASVSLYTHMLEALTHAFVPEAKDVLVLGLGAGIVPRNLAREGKSVTVVEINPKVVDAARHFGFEPAAVQMRLEDARTFVHRCRGAYDSAVVDLFLGDNIPDYLLSREFFGDLRRCLRVGGAIVLNGFSQEGNDEPTRRLAATIATAFPRLFMTGLRDGNLFIVGLSGPPPARLSVTLPPMPNDLVHEVEALIRRARPVREDFYQFAEPVSDDHNIFSVLFAGADMARRQELVGIFPPKILVN